MTELTRSYKLKYQLHVERFGLFGRYLLRRVIYDRINVNAGYLAYITLLSLVPMLTVLVYVFSKFPIFNNVGVIIQDFVLSNFVPAAGDAMKGALDEFISNTGKMTAVGGAFLFIAALMLISNIDKTLNYIWRVADKRRKVFSFSMYWMVLTLGPILIGASIVVTSYVLSLDMLNTEAVSSVSKMFVKWLPFILSLLAFMGLYLLVPNKEICIWHAFVGSLTAGILFELSKRAFAAYITQFPSYQLIYGALAAIPILFVWVYLCWMIVLIGAEVTASLGEEEYWVDEQQMQKTAEEICEIEEAKSSDSIDPESK